MISHKRRRCKEKSSKVRKKRTNITLLVLDVANNGRANKAKTGNGKDGLEGRGALVIVFDGREDGKGVDDQEDKDPRVVEREGKVKEQGVEPVIGRVVLTEIGVNVRNSTGSEDQGDERKEGVARRLLHVHVEGRQNR